MKATYKFRVERQGKAKAIDVQRPARRVSASPAVHPVARRLALAYFVERAIEAGTVAGYAEAARRLGITRARLTQVMDLLLLPVEVQEGILLGNRKPTKLEIQGLLGGSKADDVPPPG